MLYIVLRANYTNTTSKQDYLNFGLKIIDQNDYLNHPKAHANYPLSKPINITCNIYLDQETRVPLLFADITTKLVVTINEWFKTNHKVYFKKYQVKLTFKLIFDKKDTAFESPIATTTYQKKIKNKIYYELWDFQQELEKVKNMLPKEINDQTQIYVKQINNLYEKFNKKLVPHIKGHEYGRTW